MFSEETSDEPADGTVGRETYIIHFTVYHAYILSLEKKKKLYVKSMEKS